MDSWNLSNCQTAESYTELPAASSKASTLVSRAFTAKMGCVGSSSFTNTVSASTYTWCGRVPGSERRTWRKTEASNSCLVYVCLTKISIVSAFWDTYEYVYIYDKYIYIHILCYSILAQWQKQKIHSFQIQVLKSCCNNRGNPLDMNRQKKSGSRTILHTSAPWKSFR